MAEPARPRARPASRPQALRGHGCRTVVAHGRSSELPRSSTARSHDPGAARGAVRVQARPWWRMHRPGWRRVHVWAARREAAGKRTPPPASKQSMRIVSG